MDQQLNIFSKLNASMRILLYKIKVKYIILETN